MRNTAVFWATAAVLSLAACSPKPKYQKGDFLIPATSSEPTKIVLVVAVSDSTYKVFTHFLSDGKLVQAQDYKDLPRSEVETGYVVVTAPPIEGKFSPDRFLSEKTNQGSASGTR